MTMAGSPVGTWSVPASRSCLGRHPADKIDTTVVYRVDRLTRWLSDFASIVESVDGQEVSFVSVTQQFNINLLHGQALAQRTPILRTV